MYDYYFDLIFQENVEDGRVSIYQFVIFNISKEMICFSDFFMFEDFLNFLYNFKFLEYFRIFVKKFDFLKYIQFQVLYWEWFFLYQFSLYLNREVVLIIKEIVNKIKYFNLIFC